jgi:hypothetical protein
MGHRSRVGPVALDEHPGDVDADRPLANRVTGIDHREHDADRDEPDRHDSHGPREQAVESIDQVRGVRCPQHHRRDEQQTHPVVDALQRHEGHELRTLPDHARVGEPVPDLHGLIGGHPDVQVLAEPRPRDQGGQQTADRVGAEVGHRQARGSHQLTGEFQPGIPVDDVVEHTRREDREHAEDDRVGHRRVVDQDPLVARRDPGLLEAAEDFGGNDACEHAGEDRGTAEIGDGDPMDLANPVGPVDDAVADRQPATDRNRPERHQKRDEQDRQKRVEEVRDLRHEPGTHAGLGHEQLPPDA